jgi:lambda repressor-like predicted transcriptional regulator
VTASELRALADEQEARGHACRDRGDVEGAIAAYSAAEVSRLVAAGLEAQARSGGKRLPAAVNKSIMDSNVYTAEHKVEMSRAKVDPKNKLALAAHGAGLSMADLAKKAGVSPSLLNKASKGLRAMPARAADTIQTLTGYPKSAWKRLS